MSPRIDAMVINDQSRQAMCEALLPMMDNPLTFTEPLPACSAERHDWNIVNNSQYPVSPGVYCRRCGIGIAV